MLLRTRLIYLLIVSGILLLGGCTRSRPQRGVQPVWTPPPLPASPGPGTVTAPEPGVEGTPTSDQTAVPAGSAALTPQTAPTPTPATQAPVSQPTTETTSQGTISYIVRSGDTLFSIAQRFGTNVETLMQLNNLSNSDEILVDQVLQVPVPPGATTHTVQSGETLFSIAQSYGISLEALASANNIMDPDSIYVGQVLIIPGSSSSTQEHPRIHIVQEGDTLLGIALQYQVDVNELARVNGITDPDSIYTGQRLTIP